MRKFIKNNILGIGGTITIVLFFASIVICQFWGNNYKDVYDPKFIAISGNLLFASFVTLILTIILDTYLKDKKDNP